MVQVQILSIAGFATVLTGILVPLENVVPREFYFFFRQVIINQKQNDSRHPEAKRNGAD
jgi:hypothetical protein